MNKKEIIKLLLVISSIVLTLYFLITELPIFNVDLNNFITYPILFIMAIPFFMYYKYDKKDESNKNFIYKLIMICIVFSSLLIFGYLLLTTILPQEWLAVDTNVLYTNYFHNWDELFIDCSFVLYIITLFATLIFSIYDLKHKSSNINYVATIITSIAVILIHLNFYLNKNFDLNTEYLENSTHIYITQNYIYFFMMYSVIIINRFIQKASK